MSGSVSFKCHNAHGSVNLRDALAASCDVYYYHVGLEVTETKIAAWARKYGLGQKSGIDLPGEKAGNIPTAASHAALAQKLGNPDTRWYPGLTANMSIGQGEVQTTPLQMALAVSAIANGGTVWEPHVVRDATDADGTVTYKAEPKRIQQLGLKPRANRCDSGRSSGGDCRESRDGAQREPPRRCGGGQNGFCGTARRRKKSLARLVHLLRALRQAHHRHLHLPPVRTRRELSRRHERRPCGPQNACRLLQIRRRRRRKRLHGRLEKMFTVTRIIPELWEIGKRVRLAALQEAPYAFGTRYEDAVQRADEEWREFAATRAVSANDATFLAFADENAIGIAGGYRERENPELMHLVSVWVAPEWRGSGVADSLIEAVCDWAQSVGATALTAWVAEGNDRALRVYNRLGFVTQPDRQPLPAQPRPLRNPDCPPALKTGGVGSG